MLLSRYSEWGGEFFITAQFCFILHLSGKVKMFQTRATDALDRIQKSFFINCNCNQTRVDAASTRGRITRLRATLDLTPAELLPVKHARTRAQQPAHCMR